MKRPWALPKKGEIVFHPFLFALFPVLSLYVKNVGKGFLREALAITAGVFVLSILLWLLAYLVLRDKQRSAIVASVFFVLFFSHGHAISVFRTVLEHLHLQDRVGFLVHGNAAGVGWAVLWAILLVAASRFAGRLRSNLGVMTQLLNVVSLALVVMVGVTFLRAGGFERFLAPSLHDAATRMGELVQDIDMRKVDRDSHRTFLPMVSAEPGWSGLEDAWLKGLPADSAASSSRPDIYYVILDMYIRPDYLKEIYSYDPSEFLAFLADRGFYIAGKSRSNYPYTTHSMASSLNFMYLDEIASQVDSLTDHGPSVAMINNSRLVHYLRQQGYTFVAFSTGFWFTEIKAADIYMEPSLPGWNVSKFQAGLINSTPLSLLPIVRGTQDDMDRGRVLYALDHIPDATQIDSPTFVFAHISSPHDPYVFGPNGEPVQSKSSYTYGEYVEAYRNQVAFLNHSLQQVIDEILTQSPEPPVIILQGDHGACYGTKYDVHIAERTAILNAYYFPDQNYAALYESITPVNTFRVVLNAYFGADYELLDDRSYYSRPETPYLFRDVTEQVLVGD
jgi:hypothetical protein